MRVDFVVPRYGESVVGGAEFAIRKLAEHLAERAAFEIGVLTTCAVDARSWADELPEGTRDERGVRVHRFSAVGRSPDFDRFSELVLGAPEAATHRQEAEWLRLQGPLSERLVDAVRSSTADLVVFSPYLFHPTVYGVRALQGRAVLHPAAHDEAVLRLPMYAGLFGDARGLVFYTHAEQHLVQSRFPIAATPQIVLGLGTDEPLMPREARAAPLRLADRPFLLCLGRVEGAKGTDELAWQFARYKARYPGRLALVFAGPVANQPPPHPDIIVAGLVDEHTKAALLRDAVALVSPSRYESFGLVLLEAWMAGTPVLVNGHCDATRELCERSGGGVWFRDGAEFDVALSRLVAEPGLRECLASSGREYTRARFTWPVVVGRYAAFLQSLV